MARVISNNFVRVSEAGRARRRASYPRRLRGNLRHTRAATTRCPTAAVAYTLIEFARLNGVDPQAWLAQVLERLPDCEIYRVDELLPWNTEPVADPEADR